MARGIGALQALVELAAADLRRRADLIVQELRRGPRTCAQLAAALPEPDRLPEVLCYLADAGVVGYTLLDDALAVPPDEVAVPTPPAFASRVWGNA